RGRRTCSSERSRRPRSAGWASRRRSRRSSPCSPRTPPASSTGLTSTSTAGSTWTRKGGGMAKVCRGSWCMAFGFDPPATLEQVAQVLSAFGYDGIEVGGFFDHATVERFPDKQSREKLRSWLTDDLGLEIAGIAPGPYGDLFRLPWATGSEEVYDEYLEYFESYLRLAADMEIPGMRVDPGAAGPLPYDADYDEVWDRVVRTFQHHAEKGAEVGCVMLWELESLQPFNKPSETVKMLEDVGHDNFKLM